MYRSMIVVALTLLWAGCSTLPPEDPDLTPMNPTAVRETRRRICRVSAPLGEEEGKRAQADDGGIRAGRGEMEALPDHRFQKHSKTRPLWQQPRSLYLVKLDNPDACRHTQITMIRSARVFEPRTPRAARLLMPGLVILTVIVILPL